MFSGFAQQNFVRCATMEADTLRRATHSTESLEDFENWVQAAIVRYQNSPEYHIGSRAIVTIPIIFHIIHDGDAVGTSENISRAQVLSQIDILNEDFRRATGTPGFNTNLVGADIEIEFCPALVDPNGVSLAEPGIHRVNMNIASWERGGTANNNPETNLKPQTIWDPTRYCNVWTVRFGGASSNLLGYAQFPSSSGLTGLNNNGGSATTDGVVILYNACGRVGNVLAAYNGGRTLTHELGHFFGLRHIWGDGDCSVDDYCNDTPKSDAANTGCPNTNSCNDGTPDPFDMVQNYMDYTNDDCMNLFTANQKTRMRTVLQSSPRRASLINSTVCAIPVLITVSGSVKEAVTNTGVPSAKVFLDGQADYYATTDANGNWTISNVLAGNYIIYAGKWGYVTNFIGQQSLQPNAANQNILIEKGYYDDFVLDLGWTESGNASTGKWVRGIPVGTTNTANGVTSQVNPGSDVPVDLGDWAYVTGNAGGGAGDDDVDDGTTVITSPVMDLSGYTEPVVRYYRWFFNGGGSGTPNDSLVITISNGTQTITIDKVATGQNSNQWIYKSYKVKDYFPTPGNNIRFAARTFDLTGSGHLVEAGLDLFRVIDSTANSAQPPVANFSYSNSTVCQNETVSFNDQSQNSPVNWNWQFEGGTPTTSSSANPVVTYNTPGTYSVTLTVGNGSGSNILTQQQLITVSSVRADFAQNDTGICPGQSINFSNTSSCSPTSLSWIFSGGDPATSIDENPVVTFDNPGLYDVTLIARKGNSADTVRQYLAVQVFNPASIAIATVPDTNNLALGTATATPNGGTFPYTFKWSDAQGQTTATATGLTPGIYTVTITDGNGCKSISSSSVANVVTNSILDENGGVRFSLFPNPASSLMFLNIGSGEKVKSIDMYNDLGQFIKTIPIQTIKETMVLDVSDLQRGLVFVRVITQDANYTMRVVLQ